MTERDLQAIRERWAFVPGRAASVERAAWDASRRADLSVILDELRRWREWAQFVYLQGGPATLSDDDLRRLVCAAHDAQVAELSAAITR